MTYVEFYAVVPEILMKVMILPVVEMVALVEMVAMIVKLVSIQDCGPLLLWPVAILLL